MDIRIRVAAVDDLKHILHHRRAMFEEMGFRDIAVLDGVEELSREYFSAAIPGGTYRAWLAEDVNRRIVGGGGVGIARRPGHPGETPPKPAWILNTSTAPVPRSLR